MRVLLSRTRHAVWRRSINRNAEQQQGCSPGEVEAKLRKTPSVLHTPHPEHLWLVESMSGSNSFDRPKVVSTGSKTRPGCLAAGPFSTDVGVTNTSGAKVRLLFNCLSCQPFVGTTTLHNALTSATHRLREFTELDVGQAKDARRNR